jgi:hypothetical protein
VAWLLFGNAFSRSYGGTGTVELVISCGVAVLLMAAVGASVMATGRLTAKPNDSFLAYAFSPHKAFKNDLRGGMSFVVLWTAVVYGVGGVSYYWAAKAAGTPVDAAYWPTLLKVGLALLIMVAGISAFGVFASSLCKLRKNAAGLVILFVILLFAIFPIIASYQNTAVAPAKDVRHQLAAFWPMTPLLGMTGGMDFYQPRLWWTEEDSWVVSCVAYVFLTMAALGAASMVAPKRGGVVEEEWS